MQYYQGDWLFVGNGSYIEKGVVGIDSTNRIVYVGDTPPSNGTNLKKVKGAILPGLINSHCHLELSHMKGLVDTGTTLLPFLQSVVKFRDFPQEDIIQAIAYWDEIMWANGIQAVGDISNKVDTASVKNKSNIAYYTFVEMFDFIQPTMTQATIDNYSQVLAAQADSGLNKKNLVPHAPYTVSQQLLQYIDANTQEGFTISIHNQETPAENLLFKNKKGQFLEFYKSFGFDLKDFQSNNKSSIHYIIDNFKKNTKTLFVHNTTTDDNDIKAAHDWSDQVYWATCPNANLYIENSLPRYQAFIDNNAKVCIGTDSLTSNWQLNLASEMMTIQKYCSYVPFEKLTQWACINGAMALGYEDQMGSIQIGKKPGLIKMDVSVVEDKFILNSDNVNRLC